VIFVRMSGYKPRVYLLIFMLSWQFHPTAHRHAFEAALLRCLRFFWRPAPGPAPAAPPPPWLSSSTTSSSRSTATFCSIGEGFARGLVAWDSEAWCAQRHCLTVVADVNILRREPGVGNRHHTSFDLHHRCWEPICNKTRHGLALIA
jgi:hypothetical protein